MIPQQAKPSLRTPHFPFCHLRCPAAPKSKQWLCALKMETEDAYIHPPPRPISAKRRCSCCWRSVSWRGSAAVKQSLLKYVNKWWKTSAAKIRSVSTCCVYSGSCLGPSHFPLQTVFALKQCYPSLPPVHSPRPYLVFCSSDEKQQLAPSPPCGLIKLLLWLLSVSLIRPLTWTSETVTVYSYRVKGPVVMAGSRGVDQEGDDIQAHWELGRWAM